ncbi:uncharacterized protein EI90DRAFT_3072737 [Cantharellus anzutake]|uniref:uncharacterized protein n=1 Tax=Cantharellus anzutake TaxID=1750568 RepID=UPI0019060680|nr:uncharacterized protein EI90DRAFT_3072737 [Cantharellus anzutake]KAF8325405.1 hypothetical protein EI90DRAFT_3072737 [Cantharellus anzutake]
MSLEQKANSLERRVDGLVAAGGDFAIPVLAAISSRLDVFPPVKSATSGALFIFNQVKESQENKETWASFGKYVVDVVADAVISTKSYARCAGEVKPWAESITKLNDVLHEITYQMRAEMVGPLAIMNPSLDLRERLRKYQTISTVSLTSSGKENFQDHPACRQWDDLVFSQLLYPRDAHHDPRKHRG